MRSIVSQDGTRIAFDQLGSGPAVILVSGALGTRSQPTFVQLAELLSPHFSVFNYDRRGRGDSGDTPPYMVAREIEDIEALINEAGGSAFLYGISSGAVLALEATSRMPAKVPKLAIYEPPFMIDDSRPRVPENYVARLDELVAAGRPGDAVEFFLTKAVGVPEEFVGPMRSAPMWAGMEATAHTLAYDGRIMGDFLAAKPLPAGRWASATVPTLVLDGGESPNWLRNGAKAAAANLPQAQYRTLTGQNHGVESDALAPVLIEFFTHM
jgi:pimeloyl-ACP methyl ester carboxylesterase